MKPQPSCTKLEHQLASLEDLSRVALVDLYQENQKGPAPKGLSRKLLILGIGYEMQAKRYGSRRPKGRFSRDGASATPRENHEARPARAKTLPPGTRLIREWNGITHRVEVEKEALLWRGRHYSSLSAVARAITGARWSGPRFFNVPGKPCP